MEVLAKREGVNHKILVILQSLQIYSVENLTFSLSFKRITKRKAKKIIFI